MSWERDTLWAKAKLFFERAFNESRDEPFFGLWCSLGIELLGRAAISSVSPTLLAEPSNDHKYLLHALNRGSERVMKKSIPSSVVFNLCLSLFPDFTDDDFKCANALINRRNEELHTGSAAFEQYPASQWLAGFYKTCNSLCNILQEELGNLFGDEETTVAKSIIEEDRKEVIHKVKELIAAHKQVFNSLENTEKDTIRNKMLKLGEDLARKRFHRVNCPSCNCVATLQGITFGKEHVTQEKDEIIVRQPVSPTHFECKACNLKLTGYAELEAAQLGGQYMRKTSFTPDEYYGLIHPDDVADYIEEHSGYYAEYDNEQ